ncbi:MAG: hypothetical protein ACO3AE_10420, partial [Robiginitalea sp.]
FFLDEDEDEDGARVSPWGPFAAVVASGKFRHDGLRDSEARYDLEKGDAGAEAGAREEGSGTRARA